MADRHAIDSHAAKYTPPPPGTHVVGKLSDRHAIVQDAPVEYNIFGEPGVPVLVLALDKGYSDYPSVWAPAFFQVADDA